MDRYFRLLGLGIVLVMMVVGLAGCPEIYDNAITPRTDAGDVASSDTVETDVGDSGSVDTGRRDASATDGADVMETSPDGAVDSGRDTVVVDTDTGTGPDTSFPPTDTGFADTSTTDTGRVDSGVVADTGTGPDTSVPPTDTGRDTGTPDTYVPPADTGRDTGPADTFTCPTPTSLSIEFDRRGGETMRFAVLAIKVYEANGTTVIADWDLNRCMSGLSDVPGTGTNWLGCAFSATGLPWSGTAFTRRVVIDVIAGFRTVSGALSDPACPNPDTLGTCPAMYVDRWRFVYGCTYTRGTTPMNVEMVVTDRAQIGVRFRTP